MILAIGLLLVTQLLVPVLFIVWLWRGDFTSVVAWLAAVLGTGSYLALYLLAGRWDWVGYPLRFVLPAAFLVAVLVSLRRLRARGAPLWRTPSSFRGWTNLITGVLLAVVFGVSGLQLVRALSPGDVPTAELSFPLQEGVSYVAQGGSSPGLNYHNVDRAQRYAVDIGQLNAVGTRASGLYPSDLDRYAVFGAVVTSPCAGEVLNVQDGRPDARPPASDPEVPAGNHVVVRCAKRGDGPAVDVLLAHLREGSVAVEEGDEISEGQRLGLVGNSGNTTEPHLHVHAVRSGSGPVLEGEGVPMLFEGRFLVRNSLVF